MWKPCLSVKDVADVHYHSGLTWWALLMTNDEKIILIYYINKKDMENS